MANKNSATKEMQIINILRIHLISNRTSIIKKKHAGKYVGKRNSDLTVGGSVN